MEYWRELQMNLPHVSIPPAYVHTFGTNTKPHTGEHIGSGACGEVRALFQSHDKVVKISQHRDEATACERIMQHGRHFAHVVQVYDVVRRPHEGRYYIVMERLRAPSGWHNRAPLRQAADAAWGMVRHGKDWPHGLSQASERYLSDILLGVQELASIDIVHDDIHGGNVMLDAHGRVRIIDFTYTNGTDR